MKRIYHLLSLFVLLLSACHREADQVVPDASKVNQDNVNKSARISAATKHEYVFIFSGDGLYRVQTSNKEVRLLATGWSGTKVATTLGDNIYAIQGDVLWRYNPLTGVGAYVGSGWTGVEAMTSTSDGNLYMIWGGSLWRTNPNTGVAVVFGQYGWGGTRRMRGHTNNGVLVAFQGANAWRTIVTQPLSSTNPFDNYSPIWDVSKMQDFIFEDKWILNGKVGGQGFYYNVNRSNNPDFSNAIGWAETASNAPTYGTYSHIWILTPGTLYCIDSLYGVIKTTIPFNGGYLMTSFLTP